ncbi:MAG: bifunctional [glutamine synthetase] adenylyltransferase/[glutamine synthetase]-adenylyl-L-tyrosine phosphorylase, partial [Alphaproteobacteria bacterium]|nr:bifunctional [glutamine synthetase] adenylyltransferase/[glutamine synthetase]-adenylyl-L-tyrosine phosphorylase [Alphaproteobacteria bacterium]
MGTLSFLNHINLDLLPIPDDARPADKPVLAADHPDHQILDDFFEDPRGRHFLNFIAAHSDFLNALIRRDADVFSDIVRHGPEQAVASRMAALPDLDDTATTDKAMMVELRRAKRAVALGVAIADLLGLWPLEQVTKTLADLADSALERASRFALRTWRGTKDTGPQNSTDGFVILGMGKLGSRELNYSSDIDLIVLYDTQRLAPDDPDQLRQDMVRVTRQIIRLMEERTGEGYVFRTDLRLRPDPSVTPLAMSIRAAETYYESVGQNWERAAMIKARPVAGDQALGEEFLTHIRPFVWRKFLDFAAIQDIHSIKRQINAHRGGGEIAVDGHNIKIGRGGIREIEFFVQTQQLIWGGRQIELREKPTCLMLDRLADFGHILPTTAEDMKRAYVFLRNLEHRLQMVNDQQTQTMPKTAEGMVSIAQFMGYADLDEFRAKVRETLIKVAGHYARLFEESPDLGGDGSLVFTGSEDDPDTLETLSRMGFVDPSHVAERIRVWHRGRYRATRSERSRQILTELMPRILKAFGETGSPDEALQRFDNFLSGLPSGVQLFSLFQAHPALLDIVSEILGEAPRLADWLSRKPILLDSVLSEDFFKPIESGTPFDVSADDDLSAALAMCRDFQDVLDAVRRWANDQKFRIGVQLLRGVADGDRIGPAYSAIALRALNAILPAAADEFAEAHGHIDGMGMAVIAFGKLGGGELLPMSDLDLVFVYDFAQGVTNSDGVKPLGPQVYYLRLCQRLVTAITTETGEGHLYEVDTRLRPSGKAGALATQLAGFANYYKLPDGEAWTWEHMALTRARPVYGCPDLQARLSETIRAALIQPRDPAKLFTD